MNIIFNQCITIIINKLGKRRVDPNSAHSTASLHFPNITPPPTPLEQPPIPTPIYRNPGSAYGHPTHKKTSQWEDEIKKLKQGFELPYQVFDKMSYAVRYVHAFHVLKSTIVVIIWINILLAILEIICKFGCFFRSG